MYFKHPVSYSGIYISVSSSLEACHNNTLNTTIHKKHLLHDLTPNAFTKKCLKQSKVKSFKSRHLRRQLVSEHQS